MHTQVQWRTVPLAEDSLLYLMITVFITTTLNTLPKLQVRVSESGKHIHYSHSGYTRLIQSVRASKLL